MQIPYLHQQVILETEIFRDMHRSMMMHNSAIPSGEMELLLQQLRKLYGIALQLGNENAIQLLNEIQYANEQKIKQQTPVKDDMKIESLPASMPIIKEEPVAENKIKEVLPEAEIASIVNTEIPGQQSTSTTSQQLYNSNGQTVGNRFTDHATFADKMAGTDSFKRISNNIKLPVKDIHAAIGINEKFQFINQLFHGDSKQYNEFINELNSFSSLDDARKSIQQFSASNHWENVPEAKHFLEVVERKFTA